MPRSRRSTIGTSLLAAFSVTGGVLVGLAGPAAASSHEAAPPSAVAPGSPRFVDPAALPQGVRFGIWEAEAAQAELPARPGFCLVDAFPAGSTSHRPYFGAPKVAAVQYVTVHTSRKKAVAAVKALGKRLQSCHKEWLSLDIPAYGNRPRAASWERYRTTGVEDGLTVYGVFTVPPKKYDKATHLYAVGRDGEVVTVLHMSLVGAQDEAPNQAFRAAAAAALRNMR